MVMGARNAVREFAQLEGAMAKFNVVFAGQAREVEAWVDEFREGVPLARREIVQAAAAMQDLLVPMGVAREDATEMTKEWLELAAALAAFNDVPVDQALEAIRSGIAGQSRPLRQFGIDARETALQQTALAEGLIDAGEQMNDQVRQQALLIQSYAQSSDAVNGYEDQLGSTLMMEQELAATFKDTQAALGRQLQPAYNSLLEILTEALTIHEQFANELRGVKVLFTELPGPISAVVNELNDYIEALQWIEENTPIGTSRRLLSFFRDSLGVIGQVSKATEDLGNEVSRYFDLVNNGFSQDDLIVKDQVDVIEEAAEQVAVLRENIQAIEPQHEIFDPVEEARIRKIRQEAQEFDDTLFNVLNTTLELPPKLEEIEESTQNATGAADFFSRTFADGLDQVLFRARSVEDAIKGIIRQLASRALTTGIMGLLGGGFGGSFVGAMFGGNRASGGHVEPGRGYIVGERGPEMFYPQSSGTIATNQQMEGGSKKIDLRVHVTGEFEDRNDVLRTVVNRQTQKLENLT